jgi:xanthine/uracil/vitamin C permease (AzgA family)
LNKIEEFRVPPEAPAPNSNFSICNIILGVIIAFLLYLTWSRGGSTPGIVDTEKIGQLEESFFRMESEIKGSLVSVKNDIQQDTLIQNQEIITQQN